MKNIFYTIAILAIIACCLQSCARLFGGMSKDKAATTLKKYLSKHINHPLAFENLNRFWNEGNMNPNMFSVEIFEKGKPDLRFPLYFDAKLMKEKDSLYQGGLHKKSIEQMYKETKADYQVKQHLVAQLKKKDVILEMDYATATVKFTDNPSPHFIKETLVSLLKMINQHQDSLLYAGSLHFNVQLPSSAPQEIQAVTATPHEEWQFSHFTLNSKTKAYQPLQESIQQGIKTYVKTNANTYQMHPYRKLYVNADTFKEAVWIQCLSEREASNNSEMAAYKAPVTAVIFQFFDIEDQSIKSTEILPLDVDRTFEEQWEKMDEKLAFSVK